MSEPTNPEAVAARPDGGSVPPPPPPTKKAAGKSNTGVIAGVAAAAAAATAAGVVFGDDIVDAVTGGDDDSSPTADAADETDSDRRYQTADAAARAAEAAAGETPVAPAPAPIEEAPPAAAFSAGGGGGGSSQPRQEPRQQQDQAPPPVRDEAPLAPPLPPPTAEAAPAPDAAFDSARAQLLERIESLDLGAGAGDTETAALREELKGMVDRFQPGAGQATDEALAGLRDQYDQRIQDFTQDQKIQALIEEQLRDNEADPADPLAPADPAVIDPAVIDPTLIDPAATDPAAVDPAVVDPALDPMVVDPAVVDPAVDPMVVDPGMVDPALDPTTIDPAVGPDDAINTNVEESGSVFMPAVDGTVASDPDDGGEVFGNDVIELVEQVAGQPGMIVDDFESMSDQYQEVLVDVVPELTEGFNPPDSMPFEDILGDSIAELQTALPDFGAGLPLPSADDFEVIPDIPELPLVGETGFPEEVVEELQESWAPMVDDAAAQAEDFVQDQVEDITEQAQDTLGGIADDLGL